MRGVGTAGGAGTIVNAMATGHGAAFGLAYKARAAAWPDGSRRVYSAGRRLGRAEASLANAAADEVQKRLGERQPLRIDIDSDIPSQRGLKSSSAVAVAVIRAVLDLFRTEWTSQRILEAAAHAGLRSGTSVTGAFDDAAACALGGVVLTDNRRMRLLDQSELPRGLAALVNVPRRKLATRRLRGTDFRPIRPLVELAWRAATTNQYADAMLLNTMAYAPFLGHRARFTFEALKSGAWAAGLSGKGPAEIALGRPAALRRLHRRFPGSQIVPIRRRHTS